MGADLQLQEIFFPQEYGEGTNTSLFKLELDPLLKWKYGENWRFYFRPVFIANPDNKSTREQYFFDPTEAYVKYQKNVLNIQAGFNSFTWGVTDGYNPVDIVNTKQLFDPLNGKKIGALSLSISESLPWFDYDLIYIPWSRGAILPGENSRWLPRQVFVPQTPDNDIVLLLPNTLHYHYRDHSVLDNAQANNVALRLQKSVSIFDFALSGYDGIAQAPIIEPFVDGNLIEIFPKKVYQMNEDVTLDTKDYRLSELGFSLVSHQWDFLFKYESSYNKPHGNYINLPGWSWENVLGLEKTWNIPDGTMITVLQYSFLHTEKVNDSNISVMEIFRRAWMFGARLTWREVWMASLFALYDQVHSSHTEQLQIGRRFFDVWTANLSANYISGSIQNPLGLYEKNDSYGFNLSRSF
ncbi:MAG TPA: hypothetical protein VN132_12255 [Bdellovibrio sp.]|nr:hypothetical protein [Bdellovibrio sp.]